MKVTVFCLSQPRVVAFDHKKVGTVLRPFLLTWPTAKQICCDKGKSLLRKRFQSAHRISLGHQSLRTPEGSIINSSIRCRLALSKAWPEPNLHMILQSYNLQLFQVQIKSITSLINIRACLHGGGGPQVGEVTCLGEVKK